MEDSPVVSPNWLLSTTDQEVAVAAVKRAREAWGVIEGGITVGAEIVRLSSSIARFFPLLVGDGDDGITELLTNRPVFLPFLESWREHNDR